MLFVYLFWLTAAWLNFFYACASLKRVSRSEHHLILRRCWIPGYLVYHDALFSYAEAADLAPFLVSHERMVYQMARRVQSGSGSWLMSGNYPTRARFFIPLGAWEGNWNFVVSVATALLVYVSVLIAWNILGLIACFDRLIFESKTARQPIFYRR